MMMAEDPPVPSDTAAKPNFFFLRVKALISDVISWGPIALDE